MWFHLFSQFHNLQCFQCNIALAVQHFTAVLLSSGTYPSILSQSFLAIKHFQHIIHPMSVAKEEGSKIQKFLRHRTADQYTKAYGTYQNVLIRKDA